MFAQWSPKERVVYVTLVALLLGAFAYVGAQRLRPSPELKLEPLTASQAPGPGAEAAPKEVVVHVVGAVNRPGVVRLSPEARVQDAIDKAGGAKAGASLSEINLAAKLVDGSQLLVPAKGQAAPAVAEPYRGGGSDVYRAKPASSGGTARSPAPSSISLNTAGASQLDQLPGVGPATAAKILEYRQAHGGFTSIDELLAVKGIGRKKLAAMRKFVKL